MTRLAVDRQIDEDVLVDLVMVIKVVRIELVIPNGLTCFGSPSKDACRPFVIAGALFLIPHARIPGPVDHKVIRLVVRDPTPGITASELPLVRRPDQNVLIGACRIRLPRKVSGFSIDRRKPSPNAELSAAVADDHLVFDDKRSHRYGFAFINVAELGFPEFLAGGRVDPDSVAVERIYEYFAVRIRGTASHDVTARDALSSRFRLWLIAPFDRSVVFEVEGVQDVGKGRRHIHRVADHDRGRFLTAVHAC